MTYKKFTIILLLDFMKEMVTQCCAVLKSFACWLSDGVVKTIFPSKILVLGGYLIYKRLGIRTFWKTLLFVVCKFSVETINFYLIWPDLTIFTVSAQNIFFLCFYVWLSENKKRVLLYIKFFSVSQIKIYFLTELKKKIIIK